MILVPSPHSRGRRRKRIGLLAVALSIAGHALFVAVLLFLSMLKLNVPEGPKRPSGRPVVLRGLSQQDWDKNRAQPPGPQNPQQQLAKNDKPKPKAEEKKKPEPIPQGQVVDVAPGNNQVDPNAKYLAESNNTVKKETHAKDQTANYRNAMPKRTATQKQTGEGVDAVEKAQIAGNDGIGQDDRPLKDKAELKSVLEVPDVKARTELAMKTPDLGPGAELSNRTETMEVKGNSNRLRLQPGSEGGFEDSSQGRVGDRGVPNLLPSAAVVDKIIGAAPNDHLRDTDEGEGTFLNTKEWKFAGFFNRVKQSVGQHWNPNQQLRLRDPTFNIYGTKDRYTVLNVTLDERGKVRDIYVEKSSGLDFLDLEAIQSFERAQPFPNPPPGLIAEDSSVKFQFGFFVELSGAGRMRLFRSAN